MPQAGLLRRPHRAAQPGPAAGPAPAGPGGGGPVRGGGGRALPGPGPFQEVNDSFGHDAGDALLVGAAERLGALVRKNDTVARLVGRVRDGDF